MKIEQKIQERLAELADSSPHVTVNRRTINSHSFVFDEHRQKEIVTRKVSPEQSMQWGASCLNILRMAFGNDSSFYSKFDELFKRFPADLAVERALGIMKAALDDYSQGFSIDLRTAVSGEIFQDFLGLAKRALAEGNKDVAAVLASAALEDTLKRYAEKQGLSIDDRDLADIVNTLKAQGLVGGTLKNSLGTMVKIRNCAMHADWSKITEPDVSSLTAFVEQFLITYF